MWSLAGSPQAQENQDPASICSARGQAWVGAAPLEKLHDRVPAGFSLFVFTTMPLAGFLWASLSLSLSLLSRLHFDLCLDSLVLTGCRWKKWDTVGLPQPSSGAEALLEHPLTLRQPLGLTVFPSGSRETLPVEGALQGGG